MIFKFNDYKLNETSSEYLSITDAAVNVLKEQDKPLSISEIWSEIRRKNLVSPDDITVIEGAVKYGKIVGVKSGYLDTILSRASINTKRTDKNNKNLFIVLGNNPQKFIYNDGSFVEKSVDKSTNTKKYTFIEAAQLILKQNDNNPMTALEIWEESNNQNLVETLGKTPKATMNAQMILYSDNTTAIGKKKNSIFRIIEDKPYKFSLINPNLEVQSVPDEDEILPPTEFIKTSEKPKVYVKNPFGGIEESSAICVLGESGAGKSVTIENILDFEGHEYEYIIPTAATTGLLAQFSPSKPGYVKSRLGRMLIDASKNSNTLYTAVFDEMHKSNVIEMINDELLQAISKRRNRGVRFISLDDDTAEIYSESDLKLKRGNILIPDNFGFIFISSKPKVIANNADFFNRVDVIVLTKDDREMKTSDELLSKLLSKDEKMKLTSTRND
jgi:hypothetical protein